MLRNSAQDSVTVGLTHVNRSAGEGEARCQGLEEERGGAAGEKADVFFLRLTMDSLMSSSSKASSVFS